MSAVVTEVELFPLRVPLSALARGAMEQSETGLGMALAAEDPWTAADFLYVRLRDEDGLEGWGEAYVWAPESAVSQRMVSLAIEEQLGRFVLGARAVDVRSVLARMERNLPRNEIAKGVLDLALYDLAARQVGRPVHDLIGGRGPDRIPLCGLVPLADPDAVAAICHGYQRAGYRSVRIKLGTSVAKDRAAVSAIRDRCGDDLRIRVDYNQAYDPSTAVRALRAIADFGIDAAEQPVLLGDLVGMAWVQQRSDVPLFLHEGCFSMSDLVTGIELGAVSVCGVNAERPGGLTAALRAIDYAAERNMGTIIHNQPLGLGTAIHAHLATARWDVLGHDPEIAGDVMFDDHLSTTRCAVEQAELVVPDGPGWGVEVDRDALDRFLVDRPTLLTS
jgi:muconate cycloisomerase